MLPAVLENSHSLETLIFTHGLISQREGASNINHLLTGLVCECVCLSLHLKEIEIRNFFGLDYEFQVVEFILMYAKVLNKMVISSGEPQETQDMINRKLLAIPRYSKDCQVVVIIN